MSHRMPALVWRALLGLALLALLAACSPEAGRPRGAGYGSGADPDNHPPAGQFEPCSKVFNDECNP